MGQATEETSDPVQGDLRNWRPFEGYKSPFAALLDSLFPRHRRRLLHVVLWAMTLIGALNAYVWGGRDATISRGRTLVFELGCAGAIAFVATWRVSKRVHGNLYRPSPHELGHRFALFILFVGVALITTVVDSIRRWILATSLVPLILFSSLGSTMLTLAWLVWYERTNGPVFIEEQSPRTT